MKVFTITLTSATFLCTALTSIATGATFAPLDLSEISTIEGKSPGDVLLVGDGFSVTLVDQNNANKIWPFGTNVGDLSLETFGATGDPDAPSTVSPPWFLTLGFEFDIPTQVLIQQQSGVNTTSVIADLGDSISASANTGTWTLTEVDNPLNETISGTEASWTYNNVIPVDGSTLNWFFTSTEEISSLTVQYTNNNLLGSNGNTINISTQTEKVPESSNIIGLLGVSSLALLLKHKKNDV